MKKILIVDDEPDIRFIIKAILGKGYNILEAESGEAAIEIAKREKPDLILLDIMMPGIDGYETAKRLKNSKETKNIKIAMLTAKQEEEDKLKALAEARVEWYITKPIEREKLIETVKWLLEKEVRR